MKILALDLGDRRIGAAISDGQIIAGLETIKSANRQEALQKILQLCRDEQVDKIVLGLSRSRSGQTEDRVRSFALELNKLVSLPTDFVDESFTTKEAERRLKHLKIDVRSEKYKQEIDRFSAKLILEQYLHQ